MAALKPLELVELFEDLGYRLARHSDAIRSLVQTAESTQSHVTEHQTRLHEQVQIQRQTVADDQELVAQAIDATETARATSQATLNDLLALSTDATATRRTAESKWKAWQREEKAAQLELQGAQRELAHAIHLVQQAEFAIARADSALRQASSQLQNCQARAAQVESQQNKGPRISCSAEQSAVAQAQQELSGAQSALVSAQGQQLRAERAVAQAEARLQRAIEAVAVAENAVVLSRSAEEDTNYSVNTASQASELADTLRNTATNLNSLCDKQRAILDQLGIVSSQVEQQRLEAAEILRTIYRLFDAMEHLSRSCRNDLALRADDLRRLEQRFSF